jgi:hypothetical protein
MNNSVVKLQEKIMFRTIIRIALLTVTLTACASLQAVDLMAPFRGLKGLFGKDDSVVIWQGRGQYIKIVEQDWDRDHRRAPGNDHPAQVSAPHMAVVMAALQAWRPEDKPQTDRSVPLFTDEEISLFAPMLADALAKAGPKQDVVFAVTDTHAGFPRDARRSTAGRMFMQSGRLNIIFGDVLRPADDGDDDDISHYTEPRRAGKRMEPTGRDVVIGSGSGISYYRVFERPRVDWVMIEVPAIAAAYRGPPLVATAPAITPAGAASPAGGALSTENRRLREELARLRKESALNPGAAPAAVTQPPPNANITPVEPVPAPAPVAAQPRASPAAAPPAANVPATVQQRLRLLKDLHDQGLITDQEYDAKRKEIVEQI